VKHAAIALSSVAFPLILLLAGVVAAQSAPPRKDIPAIAKAANGAIVSIVMSDKDGHAIAQGSGFLVSSNGVILTNYHVIAEGSSAVVKFPDGAFYVVDGVLASDKARDIAVIKAHGQNFRTLPLGNSDRVQVGEDVVAIGSPLSLESTVSNGIVSGIRAVEEEGGRFLQVTAPISPGSSGGPLFNMAGEVIGITTMYLKGGENLNFAIPINDAKRLLPAESAQIQPLPNEPEPVQAGTHTSDAPPLVASPPVQPPMEHAATAERCEADARAWMAQVPSPNINILSYSEIYARNQEMWNCANTAASDELTIRKNVQYIFLTHLYGLTEIARLGSYITRRDPNNTEYMSIFPSMPPKPAPKQCEKDEEIWGQQNQAGMADSLSSTELFTRSSEMATCAYNLAGKKISSIVTVATFNACMSMAAAYDAIIGARLRSYVLRRNEGSQFVSEDAAGVR
jgi:hypothetical protein